MVEKGFDRERYEHALKKAGKEGFADEATARRVVAECGGVVKAVEPRIVEMSRGFPVTVGKCLAIVTAVEGERRLYEKVHGEEVLTSTNGPHEFIEYAPIKSENTEAKK